MRSSSDLPSAPPSDPTPLAKCQVAADASSPLVTEWPASEKAHLQSLASAHTVAVAYSGCEMRIVDSCVLGGGYDWRRTTLATDMVDIRSADDLYAKLPLGAVALEGELARSGRLAVRDTVSGQLQSRYLDAAEFAHPGCEEATHYVSGISVGAFQLIAGEDAKGSGTVGVAGTGIGGGTKASRDEVVLREAGVAASCAKSTAEAPDPDCASPIQVFLMPLPAHAKAGADGASGGATTDPNQAAAIHIAFPAPKDSDEIWTLRAPGGRLICELPCEAAVGPVSGDYLQREPRNGVSPATLQLPKSFPYTVGARVTAEYQAQRGNPVLAPWMLYAAIPVGLMGIGLATWGIVEAASPCTDKMAASPECAPLPGFLIGTGTVFLAAGVAGLWWNLYSREDKFDTYEDLGPTRSAKRSDVHVSFAPGAVWGTF
jgi:hypothetical protein